MSKRKREEATGIDELLDNCVGDIDPETLGRREKKQKTGDADTLSDDQCVVESLDSVEDGEEEEEEDREGELEDFGSEGDDDAEFEIVYSGDGSDSDGDDEATAVENEQEEPDTDVTDDEECAMEFAPDPWQSEDDDEDDDDDGPDDVNCCPDHAHAAGEELEHGQGENDCARDEDASERDSDHGPPRGGDVDSDEGDRGDARVVPYVEQPCPRAPPGPVEDIEPRPQYVDAFRIQYDGEGCLACNWLAGVDDGTLAQMESRALRADITELKRLVARGMVCGDKGSKARCIERYYSRLRRSYNRMTQRASTKPLPPWTFESIRRHISGFHTSALTREERLRVEHTMYFNMLQLLGRRCMSYENGDYTFDKEKIQLAVGVSRTLRKIEEHEDRAQGQRHSVSTSVERAGSNRQPTLNFYTNISS